MNLITDDKYHTAVKLFEKRNQRPSTAKERITIWKKLEETGGNNESKSTSP